MAELKDLLVNGQSRLIGDTIYKTHTAGDNSDKLASTAYVKNAIDNYVETDPTVPAWAKESTKPSYNASEISGLVKSEEVIISQDANGALLTTLSIAYDSTSLKIQLKGINNQVISEFNASDFIKDGFLDSAELVINPSGQTAGTYLKFTWNLASGHSITYVNVTSLIDVYTAGNGIDITNHEVSIKIDPTQGEYVTVSKSANGLKVEVDLSSKLDLLTSENAGRGIEILSLPPEYQRVECITGDGTAYLDLNTVLTGDDEIEIKFKFYEDTIGRNLFGSRLSANDLNIIVFFAGSTNNLVIDFNNSAYSSYRLLQNISINTIYTLKISKNRRVIYQGNTLIAENLVTCNDTISISDAYLFFANGTPAYNTKFNGSIYYCNIKGKRNLVPVKKNNVVGMYDFISDTFFTNAAEAGTFTAGDNAVSKVIIQTSGDYKTVQSPVIDPTASSSVATAVIESITQNTNGVISPVKKSLPSVSVVTSGTGNVVTSVSASGHVVTANLGSVSGTDEKVKVSTSVSTSTFPVMAVNSSAITSGNTYEAISSPIVINPGKYSVAEGDSTTACGPASHAEGEYTIASNNAEHAQGKYNLSHSNTIHSIGIGTSESDRKNAVEVLNNGNVYIKSVGGYNGTNPSSSNTLQEEINNGITSEEIQTVLDVSVIITSRIPIVDKTQDSSASFALDPNKMYMFGTRTSLTVTLTTPTDNTIVNEYMFLFTSGSTATTLNVQNTVVWLQDPDILTGKKYLVSIENNLGIIGEWGNE